MTDSNGDSHTHPHLTGLDAGISGFEPPPDEIADLVIVCVEAVQRAVGIQPDFTPETLPIVDHYVSIARASAQDRPELLPLLSRAVGAYFGEVFRRELGGFWRLPSANVHDWAVCARSVFLWTNPVGVAYDALTGGQEHDGPRSQLHVAPEYRDAVTARLAALPEVSEDEYVLLSTRLEVLQVAAAALQAEMQRAGYENLEFDLSDYEAELNPLGAV